MVVVVVISPSCSCSCSFVVVVVVVVVVCNISTPKSGPKPSVFDTFDLRLFGHLNFGKCEHENEVFLAF